MNYNEREIENVSRNHPALKTAAELEESIYLFLEEELRNGLSDEEILRDIGATDEH